MFSCEFCEILKNTSFYKTPPVAASVNTESCRPGEKNFFLEWKRTASACSWQTWGSFQVNLVYSNFLSSLSFLSHCVCLYVLYSVKAWTHLIDGQCKKRYDQLVVYSSQRMTSMIRKMNGCQKSLFSVYKCMSANFFHTPSFGSHTDLFNHIVIITKGYYLGQLIFLKL